MGRVEDDYHSQTYRARVASCKEVMSFQEPAVTVRAFKCSSVGVQASLIT